VTAILASTGSERRLRRGEAGFTRVAVAMFAAGAAVFALLYSAQAVLPQLSTAFQVSPARAGLSMSVATLAIAVAVIPASALSERWGRARVLMVSVGLAAMLGLLLPLSPNYQVLLTIRALQGIAIAGMPAVAMAYLADEIHPSALAGAVGTFIAGNALGGLAGRLLASAATDLGGWRLGLSAVSVLSVGCAVAFALLLPRQRHGTRDRSGGALRRHLGDSGLRRLYLTGFVLMGGFVTVYNYLGYRLLRPPFSLSPTLVGLIFFAYLAGTAASAVAGRLADRHGARAVLCGAVALAITAALLTLPDELPAVLIGLALITAGFFAAHAAASGWIGRLALTARGQAAGLYLFAYYAGSSLGGWVGGLIYERAGWTATIGYVVALFALALTPALRRRPARSA
jgi:MFS transporter, YNFM family, putative membrane transport protein